MDPVNDEIHTQNIECLWSRLKMKIKRMFGSEEEMLSSYFHKFTWREQMPRICIFSKFIFTITRRHVFI